MSIDKKTLFNFIFIAFAILWDPVNKAFLGVDSLGRTLFLLTTVILIYNWAQKQFRAILLSPPIVFWLVWVAFSSINLYFTGYHYPFLPYSFFVVNKLVMPLMVMTTCCYEFQKNRSTLLSFLLYIAAVYSIIGFFFLSVSYIDEATDELTLGNYLGLNTVFVLFFASLLYFIKKINITRFIIFSVGSMAIIIMSATRKAFGAAIIVIILFIFSQLKMSLRNFVFTLILCLSIYYTFNYVMDNTLMGERLSMVEETGEKANTTNIKALDFLGDRAVFYVNGFGLFLQHPLTGIGLRNYAYETQTLTIHSEYIVQLCECGIIGSLLYLMFNFWILGSLLKVVFKRNHKDKGFALNLLGGILAILFISLTAWTYDFPIYFASLGVIISYFHVRPLPLKRKPFLYIP